MGEVKVYAQVVTNACQMYIIPIAVLLTMAQSVFGALFSSNDMRIDFSPIFRGMLLVCFLAGYPELVDLLGGALDEFSALIASKSAVTDALNKYQEANVNNTSWFDFSIMKWVASYFQENGVAVIRLIVMSLRDVMYAFLFISGPIALSLSIIAPFRNLLFKWLQSFITIQFWALTLGLVDHLSKFFITHYSAVDVTNTSMNTITHTDLTGYIVTNVVCVIMYLIVPWLTSLYAGGSQAGMFMSKVVGVGAALAMPAIKMATAAKGVAGASGMGGLSTAAQTPAATAGTTPYARTSTGFSYSKKNLQE
ncbi:hypothetical protein B0O44_11224 [Pedobacter nutrimenti]|uniref:TrbL/VirB6 plasmid conjugal transfer protein n=2 Tax=Pedobacter nutrimenti TaxID=1241337 RepID=A0A318U6G1_9SPHI|nr:hypothetical protein B0O44_11224 [Pedobacter nutrimenti]